MAGRLSLPALLSHAYVAFTIEFDNEFEHRMPHRITGKRPWGAGPEGPWLVSMTMWRQALRHIPPAGIAARDLLRATGLSKAGLKQWLIRLGKWWGYVTIDRDYTVRLTEGGQQAREVWLPLTEAIERRWQRRFGEDEISDLRRTLGAIGEQMDPSLPDFLPVVWFGLFHKPPHPRFHPPGACDLPGLLAKPLLAFALEYEALDGKESSEVSLPIAANILRLLVEGPARVRDLPAASGVSKEAIEMGFTYLRCKENVQMEVRDRVRWAALTTHGQAVAGERLKAIPALERRWVKRYGVEKIAGLRQALENLILDGSPDSPIFECLTPYPECWRAAVPAKQALPHYPMVLHRGGYPDGS